MKKKSTIKKSRKKLLQSKLSSLPGRLSHDSSYVKTFGKNSAGRTSFLSVPTGFKSFVSPRNPFPQYQQTPKTTEPSKTSPKESIWNKIESGALGGIGFWVAGKGLDYLTSKASKLTGNVVTSETNPNVASESGNALSRFFNWASGKVKGAVEDTEEAVAKGDAAEVAETVAEDADL